MNNKSALPFYLVLSILMLTCLVSTLKGQSFQVGVNYVEGVKYNSKWSLFKGGTAVNLTYLKDYKVWKLTAGLDARTIQWGNQLTCSFGAIKTLNKRFELGMEMQHGIALFRPKLLYTFSGGIYMNFIFLNKAKYQVGSDIELRYSSCPAYSNYSFIYHVVEIPFGLYIRF